MAWKTLSGRTGWIPWVAFALLSIRLAARVSQYAVDLPYFDQWDLWTPLFSGDGAWTFFRFQFGPVRQGLGGLAMLASATASGWSTRAETLMSAGFVIAGAALFMIQARRVLGRLDAVDAILPVLLLNVVAAMAITEAPNPAHGPIPFFLLCAAPLCFAVRRASVRLPLLVALTVAMTYTHFAIVGVPVILGLQAVEAWRSRERLAPLGALLASVLLAATFLLGYAPNPAVSCFAFPDPRPGRYLPFTASVLARPLYLPLRTGWPVIATLVFSGVSGAFAWSAWRVLRRPLTEELDRVAFLLCGSALLFAASTALGRVCLGVPASFAPRYVTYVLPALAAAALSVRVRARGRLGWLPAVLLVLCVAQQVSLELQPSGYEERIVRGKQRYEACLRAGGTASRCTAQTGFVIYPDPVATRLDEKVEYLRARRLGPFRPQTSPR